MGAKMVIMKIKHRIYDSMLKNHLSKHRQMALVSGPRQVGKTTTCKNHSENYFNWDNLDHRELILGGTKKIVHQLGLEQLSADKTTVLFDELHKFPRWKQFLKGLFDSYENHLNILVTGSSRLDTYRRIGDSLMGRYFLYHMHPFSVAETIHQELPDPKRIIRPPKKPKQSDFNALWEHGGYPEPFLKRDPAFSRIWQTLRTQQLVREDVRDLTQIQQLDQLTLLVNLLESRSAHQIVYSNLAREIQVSVDTIRRWVETLSNLHLGFLIKPWFKNISRSLRKEPKWFLRDWSGISDVGDKTETFVACHLLKAVEGWNDLGLGKFQLGYLRDKSKREVDFLVIRNDAPWFLVEVKYRQESISEGLKYFQKMLQAPFAFQVVLESEFIDADCFAKPRSAIMVPAKTFLSQLL